MKFVGTCSLGIASAVICFFGATPHKSSLKDQILNLNTLTAELKEEIGEQRQRICELEKAPTTEIDPDGKWMKVGEQLFAWGTVTLEINGSSAQASLVEFPTGGFTDPPHVSVAINSKSNGNPATSYAIYSGNVSPTHYNVNVQRVSGTGHPAVSFSWIAIGNAREESTNSEFGTKTP